MNTQCNALHPALQLSRVTAVLPQFAYRFSDEVALHEGIAKVLTESGIGFQREFVASPADRFDFLCDGGVVIEAKVHGSLAPALAQCARYALVPDVTAVVLATSRHWGRTRHVATNATVNGKPIRLIQLRGQSF